MREIFSFRKRYNFIKCHDLRELATYFTDITLFVINLGLVLQ